MGSEGDYEETRDHRPSRKLTVKETKNISDNGLTPQGFGELVPSLWSLRL